MNNVEIGVQNISEPAWLADLESFIKKVLEYQQIEGWEVSFLLCDDDFIQGLNKKYRGRDEATDVLSFEQGQEDFLDENLQQHAGDIVISLDSLNTNAIDFDVPVEEELKRLCVHGILHLMGMDHKTNDPEEPMIHLQEKILAELEGEKIS
ncbi:MAG: rRNA maturation RNase YbeY [Spirochaetales bacterium]|nr:rRNA maturation RNase YbeY [Spirochaetales bacterium]